MDTAKGDVAQEARCDDGTGASFAPSMAEFRARARELLHIQRERMRRYEIHLNGQIQALLEQHQGEQAAARQRESELLQRVEELEQQAERAELSGNASQATLEDVSRLRSERDDLRVRLEEADQRLKADPANSCAQQQFDDLQDRFGMAVQEVRELKAQNAELKEQASASSAEEPQPATTAPQDFDWETQKQRLLAELESDLDESDAVQQRDKLTVEGTIRITDQVVAEKEKEIAELRKLLDNQSSNLGSVAVGAAAIAGMLDQDELIREERENIQRMQEDWREKLRQAEVEISVERAKIARERVQMEEKLRSLEIERADYLEDQERSKGSDATKNRPRGRWLSRLGLQDDES